MDVGFAVSATPAAATDRAGLVSRPRTLGVTSLRILLVEDSPTDVALVRAYLADGTIRHALETTDRLAGALEKIAAEPPDCVLLDLNLPDSEGLETVAAVVAGRPDLPVVVLTGLDDEQTALDAVYVGAQDFLGKRHLSAPLLWRTVCYAIERKHNESTARDQALHDPLTGLANRRALIDRIDQAVLRLNRDAGTLAVLFLDLDRFKWVNDSLGHAAGDQLLNAVADRLRGKARSPDLVARLSGDEFVVLCERVESLYGVATVAQRFVDALREPFQINGTDLWITASVGVAVVTDPNAEAGGILQEADSAMYRAKGRGGSCFEVYDEATADSLRGRLQFLSELHRAVERDELVVHYQPIVDLAGNAVVGAEALVRWQRPEGRLVPPGEFIDLAEETGLILPIGDFVLDTVCRRLAAWSDAEATSRPLGLKVNISARQLADPAFVSRVQHALDTTGADPRRLGLEITETALMRDEQSTLKQLLELKSLGIELIIDDFGTGYSSLTYLRVFPFDVLKIDMSFTTLITALADQNSALVGAVIELGRALNLEIIAEGVENDACAVRLRALGCRYAQGFYFGRPVPDDLVSTSGRG